MDEASAVLIASQLKGMDAKLDIVLERTSAHEPRINALESDVAAIQKDLREVRDDQLSRKGLIAAVSAAAVVVAAVGALGSQFLPVLG